MNMKHMEAAVGDASIAGWLHLQQSLQTKVRKILDTTLSHVGIVERVEKGRVYTIEGNSRDIVQEK